MSFNKDGEIKVFIKKDDSSKQASKEEPVRYGVEDLVEDSDKEELAKKEDSEDVSR